MLYPPASITEIGGYFCVILNLPLDNVAVIGRTSVDIADKVFKGDTSDIVNPMPVDCDFARSENVDKLME